MARLYQSGAELGHVHAEGLTLTGTTQTFDTTTKRTGARSFKFDTSTTVTVLATFAGALGRGQYACGYFLIPAATGLPGTSAVILSFSAAATHYAVRLTTAGKLQLVFNGTTPVQVGSDSAATITTDTWYRVELFENIGSGSGDDSAELRLDGVTVASESAATRATATENGLIVGWVTTPGTSKVIYWDDIALNDNTGSVNNTWVGDQKIYTLFPAADSAIGNWKDGLSGTTNLFGSVDNVPPIGESTNGSTPASQIENGVATAGSAYDATMQTYSAVGIGAGDTVTAIVPVVEIGSSSSLGADTLTHSGVSNPAIASTTSSCDLSSGAYPTSWGRFTGIVTENPTVVKGTAPVMRISKDIAISRVNACCLMAMIVAVSPGVVAAELPYQTDVRQHAVYRM